jgi:hypothetical protein
MTPSPQSCDATARTLPDTRSEFAITIKRRKNPIYYFIDVELASRQLIGWGTETKDQVEVHLTTGYHRVFLSKGQYNKLEKKLLGY